MKSSAGECPWVGSGQVHEGRPQRFASGNHADHHPSRVGYSRVAGHRSMVTRPCGLLRNGHERGTSRPCEGSRDFHHRVPGLARSHAPESLHSDILTGRAPGTARLPPICRTTVRAEYSAGDQDSSFCAPALSPLRASTAEVTSAIVGLEQLRPADTPDPTFRWLLYWLSGAWVCSALPPPTPPRGGGTPRCICRYCRPR